MLLYLQMIESDLDKRKSEQIYLQYRGLMFYVADRILKNQQDAEDAVHQTFVKIAENIKKISEPVCPKTRALVVTIVERVSINQYRRKSGGLSSNLMRKQRAYKWSFPRRAAYPPQLSGCRPATDR